MSKQLFPRSFILFALVSVLFHIFIFFAQFTYFHFFPVRKNLTQLKTENRKKIVLENISKIELNRLRTVGIKNGKKKTFSFPVRKKVPNNKRKIVKKRKRRKKRAITDLSSLKLSESGLRLSKQVPQKIKKGKKNQPFHPTPSSLKIKKKIKQKFLATPNINQDHLKALQHTDFDIHFDPPEGVSEDELNKIEQIFYSFRKRIYKSYLSSFMRTIDQFKLSNPGHNLFDYTRKELLFGQITFDENGHRQSIKIIRWSKNDNIQTIFEDTLKGIPYIPNPPKAFTKHSKVFKIYYRLLVN